jgi:predicted DNA-binding transcriptional regulator AlpA
MKKLEKEIKTMGVEDLAPLLHRGPKTLMRDIHRRPGSLPPRLIIPGSKRVLWLEQDVREWFNDCRT